jgi:hypothetical protein
MKFLPKVGISVVNALFPALTVKITALENWDTPGFIIRIQIIRMYLAKVLNIMLYAVLNLELATNNSCFFSSTGSIAFEPSNYSCREDQAGLNLVILVVTEAVTSKLIPLFTAFSFWLLSKCRKQSTWKKEIKVSQQVINLIYFQGLIWITYPYFPYVTVLAPFLLFADFKFQFWKLRALQIKPLEQTQSFEVLILIMRLFNVTMIIVLVYFGYFLTVGNYHGTYGSGVLCGAFDSQVSVSQVVINNIKSTSGLSEIWTYFLNYSPVFWVILLLSITQIFFSRNHLEILQEYLKDREFETEQQLEELQRKNAKLLKREQYKGKV